MMHHMTEERGGGWKIGEGKCSMQPFCARMEVWHQRREGERLVCDVIQSQEEVAAWMEARRNVSDLCLLLFSGGNQLWVGKQLLSKRACFIYDP